MEIEETKAIREYFSTDNISLVIKTAELFNLHKIKKVYGTTLSFTINGEIKKVYITRRIVNQINKIIDLARYLGILYTTHKEMVL